jgi:hypothetical protein
MGSPTSDDDPTRADGPDGPGGRGGPGHPPPGQGPFYPPPGQPPFHPPQGPSYPPPGQAEGHPGPDAPTTPSPQEQQRRGPTAPFPQFPGGYPPGAPGGPYPPQGTYGYGGPPPSGSRSNRGLVIALVVGIVILIALGAALVFAFTRDSGETVSSGRSTPTSAAPASSTPSPTGSTGSSPSSSSHAGDRTDELLAAVPPDFSDCAGTALAGDGDVAAVDCGASTTQPGPTAASFYLYDDTSTLDEVFARDAGEFDPMPEGQDCSTAEGVTVWNAEGTEGGDIACTITDEGLLIVWSDREFGMEGVVEAPGDSQDELAALADWWRTNSDFRR